MTDPYTLNQTVYMSEVMLFFAQHFKLPKDKKLVSHEWFYNPESKKVIFKLYTSNK